MDKLAYELGSMLALLDCGLLTKEAASRVQTMLKGLVESGKADDVLSLIGRTSTTRSLHLKDLLATGQAQKALREARSIMNKRPVPIRAADRNFKKIYGKLHPMRKGESIQRSGTHAHHTKGNRATATKDKSMRMALTVPKKKK